MESGEHAPRPEDVPLPDTDEIGLHEDDLLYIDPEDVPLPEDDPYETTSYNPKYEDFLRKFNTFKTNEEKMIDDPSIKDLPTLKDIRKNTLSRLKEMREDIFANLYDKYYSNDEERGKILANKTKFTPFDTENEEIQDYIELSKNISQLEKGVYTETNKELMFILGKEETKPTKNTVKKILDFLAKRKYMALFAMMSVLLGIFVDFEKKINDFKKGLQNAIAKELMKKLNKELDKVVSAVKKLTYKAIDSLLEKFKKYQLYIIVALVVIIIYYKM